MPFVCFFCFFFLFLVKSFSLCILLLLPFVVNKAYHTDFDSKEDVGFACSGVVNQVSIDVNRSNGRWLVNNRLSLRVDLAAMCIGHNIIIIIIIIIESAMAPSAYVFRVVVDHTNSWIGPC